MPSPSPQDPWLEPALSQRVRQLLLSRGVREHNHASEIARTLGVDRSQAYRRLKGDVAWSHADLQTLVAVHGGTLEALLPDRSADTVTATLTDAVAAAPPPALPEPSPPAPAARPWVAGLQAARAHLAPRPLSALLLPGAALAPGDACELVAVHTAAGWEVFLQGDQPEGSLCHAVDSLVLRSQPHLQIALLEDDTLAADALAEALRLQGVHTRCFASRAALLGALDQLDVDAFVLDWLLPDGPADGVIEAVRAARPLSPVVVVTGALRVDMGLEVTLQALAARWNVSTLDKPVRPMNLATLLRQLVSMTRGH